MIKQAEPNLLVSPSEPRCPGMTADLGMTDGMRSAVKRIRLLMNLFDLSLSDIANGSGREISKSTVHRILTGQRSNLSSKERHFLAVGLNAALRDRIDSAYIFSD